ncbi:MAG: IS1380 family transposase [Candidatus Hydrogenedentes bacterium]|nr:IS1380 family transposase [Candidatus Hydrogenedentota bacterium]
MITQCTETQLEFQGIGRRKVQADFEGGHVTSDGGALLLSEMDKSLGLINRFSQCFTDYRESERVEHKLEALLGQRIYGIALGYEDLNDHDDLLRDPLLAMALGKKDVEGKNRHRNSDKGKALASSSTLNRVELTPADASGTARYKKIVYHPEEVEILFTDVFLDSYTEAPEEIILDFDATDDPIHGNQEGRFFHGYYDCYCYIPLYVTCNDHLLVAKLREANQDASAGSVEILEILVRRIRARWPDVRIVMRADSGFCRDAIMTWCEENDVYFVVGLAKNKRLLNSIVNQQFSAHVRHLLTGTPTRVFTDFQYKTLNSWTVDRHVIAKAEHLRGGPNPRFIVTNLPQDYATPKDLYENIYCARGEMENRIKEQQLDLFADRTSSHTMRANQLRLWFSSLAYVLVSAIRRVALKGTRLAKATCGSIRLKLFKIPARVKISIRRFLIQLTTACPYQDVFRQALKNIQSYPLRV